MTALAAATEAFQTYLEGHRAHPDDDLLWRDLQKARTEMEALWLRQVTGPEDVL